MLLYCNQRPHRMSDNLYIYHHPAFRYSLRGNNMKKTYLLLLILCSITIALSTKDKLQSIRNEYYSIESKIKGVEPERRSWTPEYCPHYSFIKNYEGWHIDGKIVKIVESGGEYSADGTASSYTYSYYYKNGKPFFIFHSLSETNENEERPDYSEEIRIYIHNDTIADALIRDGASNKIHTIPNEKAVEILKKNSDTYVRDYMAEAKEALDLYKKAK